MSGNLNRVFFEIRERLTTVISYVKLAGFSFENVVNGTVINVCHQQIHLCLAKCLWNCHCNHSCFHSGVGSLFLRLRPAV